MKTPTNFGICLLVAAMIGCGIDGSGQAARKSTDSPETPRLRKGMTKAQVTKLWGEPSGRQQSGSGEIWTWGGQRWMRAIPYAGPFMNIQTSKVIFGTNGRVTDYRITDHGDAMTDIEGYSGGHNAW